MMENASARISFVTAKGKRKKLDQIAGAFDKNLSSVINDALDHYIDLHEWQLTHIEKGVEAAKKGDFAPTKEADKFFKKYGKPS
jgi:predicted transcriptional regulator